MEAPIISGVTHDVSEAKVTIFRVPDRPGIAAKVFRALADENVNVDMIEQNVSTDDHTDISFTVPRDELVRTMAGRPRKVERMPTTTDLEYHAKVIAARLKFVDEDDLVQAMADGKDPLTIFKLIRGEMAKEVASLKHAKVEIEKRGRDTVAVSGKRIDALLKLANLENEIKKLGSETVDLKSERMQRVFAFMVNTLREIATEILPPESVDLLFGKFASALEGWEERALAETEK